MSGQTPGRYKRRNWNVIDGTGNQAGSTGTLVSRIRPRGKAGPAGWSPRVSGKRRQGPNKRRWD